LQAKFSLQHAVALTLMHAAPELNDFSEEALSKTAALRKRMAVKSTDEFNQVYPAHYGAALTIGGSRYVVKDAYGDPEIPISHHDLGWKAISLMKHAGMTEDKAKKVFGHSLALAIEPADLKDYTNILP